jgi:hypothetical protein
LIGYQTLNFAKPARKVMAKAFYQCSVAPLLASILIIIGVVGSYSANCADSHHCTEQPNPTAGDERSHGESAIPSSFFAVTILNASDYPPLSFGALGHPTTLIWGWLQPESRGAYRWSVTDYYVQQAVDHHIPVMLTIGRTPGWAVSDQSACRAHSGWNMCDVPPSNLDYWRDFITAVATHYKGKVQYYELWNEANQRQFWNADPEDLVALAKVAYPIIKSIDSRAMVLTPSTVGPLRQSVDWITRYLKAGGGQYADGGTFHGYIAGREVRPFPGPEQDSSSGCAGTESLPGFRFGNRKSDRGRYEKAGGSRDGKGNAVGRECFGSLQRKIEAYRSLFDQYGLKGKPMLDTEGSWGNATISDPDVQASFLARWYLIQAGYHEKANLRQACWYAWGFKAGDTWGVITNPDDTPTAAGLAYTQVYNWVVGASVSPCTHDGSTWTCAIARNDAYKALAVWDTSGMCAGGNCTTHSYTPPAGFVRYRDLSGATTLIGARSAPIGLKPILLENK